MSLQTFLNKPSLVRQIIYWTLGLLCVGCAGDGNAAKSDIIVRYRQHNLSRAEIDQFVPETSSGEDSSRYASRFIEEWVRGQAVSEHAKARIDGLNEKIAAQMKEYERDLIRHAYAQFVTEQNAEELRISEAEINSYYTDNPEKFISDTEYFQFFFVRTKEYSNQQVVPLMRRNDEDKLNELREWVRQNAVEYRLDSSYVTETELSRVGEGYYYGNIKRSYNSTVYPYSLKIGEETYYNYFRLLNTIEAGDRLPLRICAPMIRNILYNQKKNNLIEREEAALVQQARSAKKIKRYDE
ncbi:MAG: hypothetical protein AAFN10_03790 [Bacteroidota bacterium]